MRLGRNSFEQVLHKSFEQIELVTGHGKRFCAKRGLRNRPGDSRGVRRRSLCRGFGGKKPKRYWSYSSGHDANELERSIRDDSTDDDFHKRPLRMAPADRPAIKGALVRSGNAELDAFDDFAGRQRMIGAAVGAVAE